jgi:hypothetical protein
MQQKFLVFRTLLISDLDEEQFFLMFMHFALDGAKISDQELLRSHKSIGRKIADKLGRSPLAARIVAGQLKIRLDFDFWTRAMNSEMLNNGTMATLWWSYQQLEEHVKRCFTYCSIFPRTYKLKRNELVHLWMAEGFVKTTEGPNRRPEGGGGREWEPKVPITPNAPRTKSISTA